MPRKYSIARLVKMKEYRNSRRELLNENARIYRANHADEINARRHNEASRSIRRAQYHARKEYINAKVRARWALLDPFIKRALNQVRSCRRKDAIRKASDGTVTAKVIRDLIAQCSHCSYCQKALEKREIVLDHAEPLAAGGPHSAGNLIPCCARCNRLKHAMPYTAWIELVR